MDLIVWKNNLNVYMYIDRFVFYQFGWFDYIIGFN